MSLHCKLQKNNKKGDKLPRLEVSSTDVDFDVVGLAASQSIKLALLSQAEIELMWIMRQTFVDDLYLYFLVETSPRSFAVDVTTCLIISFVFGIISICWNNYRRWTFFQATGTQSPGKVERRTMRILKALSLALVLVDFQNIVQGLAVYVRESLCTLMPTWEIIQI